MLAQDSGRNSACVAGGGGGRGINQGFSSSKIGNISNEIIEIPGCPSDIRVSLLV